MESNKIIASGLLEQYVLGLTSEEENKKVEYYMTTYPEVKDKVVRLRSCMDHYTGLHNIPCPTKFRQNRKKAADKATKDNYLFVETKFGQSVEDSHIARRSSDFSFVNIVSFMLLFLAGSSVYFYYSNGDNGELSQLETKIHHLEKKHNTASSRIHALEKNNQILKDLHTRKVLMNSSNIPEAKAVVYYNDVQQKALLDPLGLPKTHQNQCYYIWAELNNRKKVCMGEINPVSMNSDIGLMPLNFVKDVSQLIITRESNGKEQPFLRTSFH